MCEEAIRVGLEQQVGRLLGCVTIAETGCGQSLSSISPCPCGNAENCSAASGARKLPGQGHLQGEEVETGGGTREV
eukprot:752948-Hanusia_phi.AAC.3